MCKDFPQTRTILLLLTFFVFNIYSYAQLWSPILNASQAIDWSSSGVDGIPARTSNCASLDVSRNPGPDQFGTCVLSQRSDGLPGARHLFDFGDD